MSCETNAQCTGEKSREGVKPDGDEGEMGTKTTQNENCDRVDREVSLLVAAGSAMAAGCEPCLDQLIPGLISEGVSDQDIRKALQIGQRVKDAAADYLKEVANVLADTCFDTGPAPRKAPERPTKEPAGCCG